MPEAQTVKDCAALRENCRGEIFSHAEDLHKEVMGKLATIEQATAYQKGRESNTGEHSPVSMKKVTALCVGIIVAVGGLVVGILQALK